MATLQQVRREIQIGLKKLGRNRVLLQRMANQALADSKQRIFFEGKNSKGSRIGQYKESTKRQRAKFGRQTARVNLDFTGQLKGSYITDTLSKDKVVLGFFEISRKTMRNKQDKTKNSELVDILEDKYGDVFALTSKESERLDAIIDDFIDEITF